MRYLVNAQSLGLEGLWKKLCRGEMIARCDKAWYFEVCRSLHTRMAWWRGPPQYYLPPLSFALSAHSNIARADLLWREPRSVRAARRVIA